VATSGSDLALSGDRRSAAAGRRRLRDDWPVLKPALVFHLITRAVVVAGLVVASVTRGRAFPAVVTRWDGRWYQRLVVHGYPSPLPVDPATGRVETNTAGFFAFYPLLVRALMSLGIPFWLGGMMINLVASSLAVLLIVLVGLQYLDRRAATMLGCLWSAFPCRWC
jgi:hypothetical protein